MRLDGFGLLVENMAKMIRLYRDVLGFEIKEAEDASNVYRIPFRAIHIESRDEAQNAPTPITNYALFHDGEYVTNEQMNDKKFLKLVNG